MYYKVKITKLPSKATGGAKTGQQTSMGSLAVQPTAMGGADIDQYAKEDVTTTSTLSAVPRKDANVEAEGGETAYGDINGDGFPEHYVIKGKRHTEGGVPLNLPDGTFIFSDTRSMKITDCNILKMFNKPCGKGGFTPADLAKPFDINKYRKILENPDTDKLSKKTAEMMIRQATVKLGALALAQESKKGFPQGIPQVARPYMEAMGLRDEDILPQNKLPKESVAETEMPMQDYEEQGMPTQMPNGEELAMSQEMMQAAPMAMYGMSIGGYSMPFNTYTNQYNSGGLVRFDNGGETEKLNKYGQRLLALQKKYEASGGKLSMEEKLAMKNELDSIKSQYEKDFGLPAGAQGSYGWDIDKAIKQAQAIGNDTQIRLKKSSSATKPVTAKQPVTQPVVTQPINATTGYPAQTPQQVAAAPQSTTSGPRQSTLTSAPYTEEEAYSPKGVVRLNSYRQMYGLPQIGGPNKPLTKADIQAAAGELQQKIIDTHPELVVDYMSRVSHQPNKALLAKLPSKYPKTTEGVAQALKEGALNEGDVRNAYKDNLWWYRALETDRRPLTKEEYEAKMKQEGAISVGDKLYFQDDPNNPQLYTEYYTEEGAPQVTPNIRTATETKKDGVRPDIQELMLNPYTQNIPLMYHPVDRMRMNAALRERFIGENIYPFVPRPSYVLPDVNYVDYRRNVAAQNEQANILAQAMSQFSPSSPQASARLLGAQGNLATNVANTIAEYNKANAGIGNQYGQVTAGIMNQFNELDRNAIKELYDKTAATKQNIQDTAAQERQNDLQAIQDAEANAERILLTNQLAKDYMVIPGRGVVRLPTTHMPTPTRDQTFNGLLDYYENERGYGHAEAINAAKFAMANQSGYNYGGPDLQYSAQGGLVLGSNVFPFMFY